MEYAFIKKDLDKYVLKYKDKEIEFTSTIGIASRIQKHQEQAETKMILDLAKQGMTINDLKVEKVVNGKKYIDEANYNEIKKIYRDNALNEVFDEICLELFNYKLADLAVDIGLETAEDGVKFASDLMNILVGNTGEAPSEEKETKN